MFIVFSAVPFLKAYTQKIIFQAYFLTVISSRLRSRILELQKEAADAHKETIRVRNYWFQVLEDMLLEFEKMQKKTKQELQEMEKPCILPVRKKGMKG